MSLMPTGSPASGRSASPGASAARRAPSISSVANAPTSGSRAAIVSAHTIDDLARREFAGRDPAGQVEGGEHQAFPSILATIRSVRRRAAGMMTKAVTAATGQAMK